LDLKPLAVPGKKVKSVVVECKPRADSHLTLRMGDGWRKFKSYRSEQEARMAIDHWERTMGFYLWRLRP
jgi:hypothetical protein